MKGKHLSPGPRDQGTSCFQHKIQSAIARIVSLMPALLYGRVWCYMFKKTSMLGQNSFPLYFHDDVSGNFQPALAEHANQVWKM